ncbi:enoyl-CoA hydratase/isomerase family protein [Marinobacter sp. R17]|uniref:enoyl-CoA hydratase-related protein n=1 Tax=Marinobacter sp. R17 TaxID=2484250 RepID=UPI000F4CD002|nr:enoyl-CoA hydratase-related protein [Marinobacter sp. R17]ROT99670.1 enoyl-CoA hydratase/isomerase family protein [Marinobacter sp. R17]
MTEQAVRTETDGRGVTRITLARPGKRNAFNDSVMRDLRDALIAAGDDPACRVVVLQGDGKHFSAGADLNYMQQTAELSRDANVDDALALAGLMQTLDQLPKPTIARVQGAAFGGALGLICACDIAIATDNARFCLSEARLGLAPAAIGPYVVRAIGPRQARRYFLTTEEIPANDAVQLGIVHEVVAAEDIDETINTLVERLLRNGPVALEACKSLVARTQMDGPDEALIRYTAELIAGLRTGDEGQEGLRAFLEKRQPAWIQE